MSPKPLKPLVVRDPIHGDMIFQHPLQLVIDHPLFQRLKFIFQNGVCYQVFPGMTHTRFQHSLGVCWISKLWFGHLFQDASISKIGKMLEEKTHFKIAQGQTLDLDSTVQTYNDINKDKLYWENLVTMAALCHDLGHGPFSHLLEEANFIPTSKLLEELPTFLRGGKFTLLSAFLHDKYKKPKSKVDHEDITLVYLVKIFDTLSEDDFFKNEDSLHIVSSLISKDYKNFYLKDNKKFENKITLLASITSGFIDVDRMDYVVRDSKMAGVATGGIEINRLITSLVPCLFKNGKYLQNGFIAHYKYNHIIDSFLFSLYQVYTQVIFHPRAISMSHELALMLEKYREHVESFKKQFSFLNWHSTSSDQLFMQELRKETFDPKGNIVDKILNREFRKNHLGDSKRVYGLPNDLDVSSLKDHQRLDTHGRKMLKDDSIIWYFSNVEGKVHFVDWNRVSVISQKLTGHSFKPNIFWKNAELLAELETLVTKKASEDSEDSQKNQDSA